MDTFGPVSDNAQGIAEMSGDVDGEGAQILTELDAVGNTTKAITKGIAIATAVLAATALFGSYTDAVGSAAPTTSRRRQQAGAGSTSSTRSTYEIVTPDHPGRPDPRRRRGVPLLRPGDQRGRPGRPAPSCSRCAASSASTPGSWTAPRSPSTAGSSTSAPATRCASSPRPACWRPSRPIAVGFGLGVGPLAGYLAGAIGTGVLMAVFLANSGGAWDNAKKIVEDGTYGGKGSDAHAADRHR